MARNARAIWHLAQALFIGLQFLTGHMDPPQGWNSACLRLAAGCASYVHPTMVTTIGTAAHAFLGPSFACPAFFLRLEPRHNLQLSMNQNLENLLFLNETSGKLCIFAFFLRILTSQSLQGFISGRSHGDCPFTRISRYPEVASLFQMNSAISVA